VYSYRAYTILCSRNNRCTCIHNNSLFTNLFSFLDQIN